jgi:hypothetical protein
VYLYRAAFVLPPARGGAARMHLTIESCPIPGVRRLWRLTHYPASTLSCIDVVPLRFVGTSSPSLVRVCASAFCGYRCGSLRVRRAGIRPLRRRLHCLIVAHGDTAGHCWDPMGTNGNHCGCGPLRTTMPTSGTVLEDLGQPLPAEVCADPGWGTGVRWGPLGTSGNH